MDGMDGMNGTNGMNGMNGMEEMEEMGVVVGDQKLSRLRIKLPHVLDKTIVLMGPSKTGKSVWTQQLMELLHGPCEQMLLFSPSQASNQAYTDSVPKALIHYSLAVPDPEMPNAKPEELAVSFMRKIWDRQAMATATYKKANRVVVLGELFKHLPEGVQTKGKRYLASLERRRQRAIRDIKKQYKNKPGICAKKVKDVNKRFKTMLALIYKKYLTPHVDDLWGRRDRLSADARFSLQYIHFNPRLLMVFDDCAAELKKLWKYEQFTDLFYRARHNMMSIIISCQDDTDLATNCRKNAFVTIYTTENVGSTYFTRASNGFSKAVKTHIKNIAPEIYKVKHRMLAWIREDERNIHYYWCRCDVPIPRMFGSPAVVSYCKAVEAQDDTLDETNPYYGKFRID